MLGGIRLIFTVRVTSIDLVLPPWLVLYTYHSQKKLKPLCKCKYITNVLYILPASDVADIDNKKKLLSSVGIILNDPIA